MWSWSYKRCHGWATAGRLWLLLFAVHPSVSKVSKWQKRGVVGGLIALCVIINYQHICEVQRHFFSYPNELKTKHTCHIYIYIERNSIFVDIGQIVFWASWVLYVVSMQQIPRHFFPLVPNFGKGHRATGESQDGSQQLCQPGLLGADQALWESKDIEFRMRRESKQTSMVWKFNVLLNQRSKQNIWISLPPWMCLDSLSSIFCHELRRHCGAMVDFFLGKPPNDYGEHHPASKMYDANTRYRYYQI